tara:strand:+ start:213 stop:440 length:228 start_codon:yes stop_codon:yes gene_type:complete
MVQKVGLLAGLPYFPRQYSFQDHVHPIIRQNALDPQALLEIQEVRKTKSKYSGATVSEKISRLQGVGRQIPQLHG